LTVFCLKDSFKINTCANKAGIGNKLVTIFAHHLDNFILTHYLTAIYEIRNFWLLTNPSTRTILSFAGAGKNCAMVACPRDSFPLTSLLLTIAVEAQTQSTAYESKTLYSNILKMDRKFSIYLPSGYESSDRAYPVVYLLHPAGPANTIPNNQSWLYYGELKQFLDKAILAGDIIPMIVVTPDANFGSKRISYFNDPEGDFIFEDFFFKEFIPFIEKNYRCLTEKGSRAIAGASMGGQASIQYALHQPDLFSVTCALSPAVRKYESEY
jgi:hypothetical protein